MRALTLIAVACLSVWNCVQAQEEVTPQRVVSNVVQLNRDVENLQRQISSGALNGAKFDSALQELSKKLELLGIFTSGELALLKQKLDHVREAGEGKQEIAILKLQLELERTLRLSEERQGKALAAAKADSREDAKAIAEVAELRAKLAAKDELNERILELLKRLQESEDRSNSKSKERSDTALEIAKLHAALLAKQQSQKISDAVVQNRSATPSLGR